MPTAQPITHTPGPWQWEGYSLGPSNPDHKIHYVHTIMEIDTIGWGFIARNDADAIDKINQETQYNLALIAAAPELLDALLCAEATMSAMGANLENDYTAASVSIALSKVRNAIAKANNTEAGADHD